LQHYRLKRDIELAVVGSDFKPNENLLPAGTLREPISRLKTVDAVINNGHTLIEQGFLMQLNGDQFVNLVNPAKTATAANFQRHSIKAFAGIGKPDRFFEHLRQLGLTFVGVEFADHHLYTAQDLTKMGGDVLIMTEKDAVKCQAFAQANYWTLPVSAQIDANLMPLILSKLKQKLGVKKT
jgi:tetraacyldisaccharide 4'-kinase